MRIAAEYSGDADESLATDQAHFDERAVLHRLHERKPCRVGKNKRVQRASRRRQGLLKGHLTGSSFGIRRLSSLFGKERRR